MSFSYFPGCLISCYVGFVPVFLALEAVMDQCGRKRYEKPRLKKVQLDAKCAVLGFCKVTGKIGPGRMNCALGTAKCFAAGS